MTPEAKTVLLSVADHIENLPFQDSDYDYDPDFNDGNWFHMRHPRFCIGGWIRKTNEKFRSSSLEEIINHFEIDANLFYPGTTDTVSHAWQQRAYKATGPQAAKAIRHYVETDVLDWKKGIPE